MHDLEGLRDELATLGVKVGQVELFDETTSTNDVAKRAAKAGAPHLSVFVADSQTAGRGRQGRAWTSARGESILMSVVLRVDCPPARLPPLSLVVGLAACEALGPVVDVEPQIKWPNDVWLNRKKVAGILVEASIAGDKVDSIVVGVGINVHTRAFPSELEPIATSVALHSATQPERASILARLIEALDRDITPVASHGLGLVHARIQKRDALRGARVRGEAGEGVAEGIDPEGRLCVRLASGALQRWVAGEVNLLK